MATQKGASKIRANKIGRGLALEVKQGLATLSNHQYHFTETSYFISKKKKRRKRKKKTNYRKEKGNKIIFKRTNIM